MQRLDVPVDEFTTPDPVTATEDLTIDELRQLMTSHGVRHLPIVREDIVIGVISDRDVRLVSGLSVEEKLQITAGDFMTPDPLAVSADTSLDEVAYLMSEKKVGSVIVNDQVGAFVGIFTTTDALNALIEIVRAGGAPDQ